MLAGGRGGWSQNVDCDIFSLHYTLYQSIKNSRNKIRQSAKPTFTQLQRRCIPKYNDCSVGAPTLRSQLCIKRHLLTLDSVGAPTLPSLHFGIHPRCTLGCSDSDFFTFWGITTHPWHPKGPRIWKLAKKNFQLHPWPAEIFGKNRKLRFFGLVSKLNFRSPVLQIFTIFSACFIYGFFITLKKFEVSNKNFSHKRMVKTGFKIYLFAKFEK